MTDETLDKIIRGINDGTLQRQAFLRKLKDNVSIGIVWPDPSGQAVFPERRYTMFFIKEKRAFVGTVLDMEWINDLHTYTLPEHRKKGHMTKALKEIILPYLVGIVRTEQCVTFQPQYADYNKNLGFQITSDRSGVITRSDLAPCMIPQPKKIRCDQARAESLKLRAMECANLVGMLLDEIRMLHAAESAERDLHEVEELLIDMRLRIDDLPWKK